MPERCAVAQVTPHAWEDAHEVNAQVRGLAGELARRGHRVLVVAPTRSLELVRETRRAVRAARGRPEALLPEPGEPPRVLGVGEALPVPSARSAHRRSLPIDVARTIEEILELDVLDLVHVHEPWAPSTASAALRHSRALNVGSFHAPTERLLATQVARRMVELVLGRLDARTASFRTTRDALRRAFPADYRVILPGASRPARRERAPGEPPRLLFVAEEERAALRLWARALRHLPRDLPWRAAVLSPHGAAPAGAPPDRLELLDPASTDLDAALAGADVLVAASEGLAPAPGLLVRGLAAGCVPVAPRLPAYAEVLAEGARGALYTPGDAAGLAAAAAPLVAEPARLAALREAAAPLRAQLTWERATDELEEVYAEVLARRHDPDPRPDVRRRLAGRPTIDVDLHMHTDHSPDCATPVEALLAAAAQVSLGAIAVTDHNEVSGALEAREKAAAHGVKVIVGEEVKTADQGEVIGLFIEERIPRGLSLEATIAEIRRQGGLVYVPHPFDRMHTVPDYEHLLAVVGDVDLIEVFNPRVAISSFNDEAARFASKYRLVCGAGSDAHVTRGLGSVRIRMRDFDGPEEFLESLREADIIRRPTSLVYVQALKFLQTRATPAPARRAVRARRVRRAGARAGRNP